MSRPAAACRAGHLQLLLWSLLTCLLLALPSGAAPGETTTPSPEMVLKDAASALRQGQANQALRLLEQLADEGFVHPDVSFTRGVAYLHRARSEQKQPGDFGQAAAAFRETLELSPDDGLAQRGLEEARIESARRVAAGEQQVIETVGLGRQLLLSLHPWALLIVIAFASLAASVGVLLRRWGKGAARTGGGIAAALGAAAILMSLPLAAASAQLRKSTRIAVVVVPRAPLLDREGRAQKGVAPLPEGTEVHFETERAGLLQLTSGGEQTWIRHGQVRILAR